jgi:PAS domain S-box-containing protein
MRILLVETNEALLSEIQTELTRQNFVVDVASDGEIAWGLLHSFVYELLILEVMLPKLDGISLCRRLREVGNPILIMLLVNPSNLSDPIQGLENGADDYLIKPIDYRELLARIHALGRRGLRRASPILSWGMLQINPISRQVTYKGQILKMSRKEYLLLELFLSHPQQTFTRSEIADRLWTIDEVLPMDATIKTHIRGIRRKLEKVGAINFIETRYGHGYRLNPKFDLTTVSPKSSTSESEILMDSVTANIWYELMSANTRLQQEINERRQKEAELARSERLLRNAQRVVQIGAWEFNIKTQKTYWTEELYLIHGLDPKQPAPTPAEVINLIHPDDRELHHNAIVIPALQRKPFEVNLRIIRTDGAIRYVNARGGPFFDETRKLIGLVGTTFDITDWKQIIPI